ncbi:MAG: patatin-like phospholipase family protein [Nitrospirae bacterium]|nr:patatin-like phospholipase family protein [Nitrospirota bacterium]MBF0533927.1 patatin-like phospholipase family protein [Nitrospirota bacterium]MBF0618035.1 patatin-like phospholipase family protein [Nitrospirota bacterium]
MRQKSKSVEDIKKRVIARERFEATEAIELIKSLKKERVFWLAREVLEIAQTELSKLDPSNEKDKLSLKLAQQLALCTYKDPDLANDSKFDDTIKILTDNCDLKNTKSQETLGIAGAVYKYKWLTEANKSILELSLAYYMRGYKHGVEKDYGYTAINAAFVLDALAYIEERTAQKAETSTETAENRRKKADEIRNDIIKTLPDLPSKQGNEFLNNDWWFLVTIAEAYFGLECYDDAREYFKRAKKIKEELDWEYESTAKQLVSLARFKGIDISPDDKTKAWVVLEDFLGDKTAVKSVFIGKVGLALSGGGFRASLFHIGVLAKLAECDILRHVDVISCVSGGSIIGAHYYLKLRNLLQTMPDSKIDRDDYIKIVHEIEDEFLTGVQANILKKAVTYKLTNITKSLTECLGEMYEKQIFSKVKDGKNDKERWINDLVVTPLDATGVPQENFNPKDGNWLRKANVPILILNTTALNTGHNFQFTATWMGEPPAGIDSEVDANYRLRRLYYEDAPPKYQKFSLGRAVAASTCVPAVFEPIELKDLYKDKVVRLVDGGVNDNQGSASLLEQNCTVLIVSDASGQMSSEDTPAGNPISAGMRSNSILQARLRGAQFDELYARKHSSLLQGLLFLHLKKELEADPVDWIGCELPSEKKTKSPLTSYGINKECQEYLSNIRTDLDSFSDIEAHSLMTSGYLMTEKMMPDDFKDFTDRSVARTNWRFLEKGMAICNKDVDNNIKKELKEAADHNLIILKIMKKFNSLFSWI